MSISSASQFFNSPDFLARNFQRNNNGSIINPFAQSDVPANANVPVIQNTSLEDIQVNDEAPLLNFNGQGAPVDGLSPVIVEASQNVNTASTAPIAPPIFFPTILESGGPDNTTRTNQSASEISNIDLGLIGAGVASIVTLGLIAAIRR